MAEYRDAVARFDQKQVERAQERKLEREREREMRRRPSYVTTSSRSLLAKHYPDLTTTSRQIRQSSPAAFNDQQDSLSPQQPETQTSPAVSPEAPSLPRPSNEEGSAAHEYKGKSRASEKVVHFTELAKYPGVQFRALDDGNYIRDDSRTGDWVVVPEAPKVAEERGEDGKQA